MNRASLETLARRWRWHRALHDVGILAAVGCTAVGLLIPLHPSAAGVFGVLAAVGVGLVLRRRSRPITASTLAESLNRHCPVLEESAALWLRDPGDLDLVERLQLRRLDAAWNSLPNPRPCVPKPARLLPVLLAAVLSMAFLAAVLPTTTRQPGAAPAPPSGVRDAPPRLTWRLPAVPRTSLNSTQNLAPIPIEILVSDDQAVAEVRLVLTLVKGSGEGLKFRERSEILQAQPVAGSSNMLCGRSLDLAELGMEPGDELYLQGVALDAKRPIPNESRSETRCVVLVGPSMTATAPAVVLSGLRRLPQYFRSQRQLILDTEQLLAERTAISEARFRERSENLGIDQKLLRLRYGQFLGEEFEPTSAGAPREAAAQEWAAALRNPVGQDADRTAAIGRAVEASHLHEPGPAQPPRAGSAPDLFGLLAHNHDSTEAATLFDDKLKSSLRSVLAAMWEAEGFLRTAQPSEALPAEQRALEILKVIQQADRLSLSRVDTESPPLRVEERRLRGELDAIPPSATGTSPTPRSDPDAKALRVAVASLSGSVPRLIPPDEAARVEGVLGRAVEAQPEHYLPALELWRSRETASRPSDLDALRKALGSLLPVTEEAPVRRPSSPRPGLENRYAEALAVPSPGTP